MGTTNALVFFLQPLIVIDFGGPVFDWVYNNLRVTDAFTEVEHPLSFWACVFATDFGYYIFHRGSHVMSWLWASHGVHHSSETFNLTTAAREGSLLECFTPSFLLYSTPLALFFPREIVEPLAELKLAWQGWFHANLAPPFPAFERYFNTPSLHRVHHCKNSDRLGKNYGAIFSMWDRMGGTFESELRCSETNAAVSTLEKPLLSSSLEEKENKEVVVDKRENMYYGIVPSVQTWNPVTINIFLWRDIWRQTKFHGFLAPFLHWTPPGSKCPPVGTRLNPKFIYGPTNFLNSWKYYAIMESIMLTIVGGFTALDSSAITGFLTNVVQVPQHLQLLTVAAFGVWGGVLTAQILLKAEGWLLCLEVVRQIVLIWCMNQILIDNDHSSHFLWIYGFTRVLWLGWMAKDWWFMEKRI